MLDTVSALTWAQPRDRQPLMRSLVNSLGNNSFMTGSEVSVVDLALYSVIRQLSLEKELQPELARWFSKAEISLGFKNKNRERKASERKSKSKSPVKEVKKEK